MKKATTTFVLVIACFSAFSQVTNPYYTIPIQHDTAIQWAAESDKVVNLTPKVQAYSLKKWYMDKLKNGVVTAYKMNDSKDAVASYELSMPALETQSWLKGFDIEIPSYKSPKEWYFYDKTIPKENYERYKYRVGGQKFSIDSCCGCDDADAFRAKQFLNYKNGKFSIYNVFISPLCARQTGSTPVEWYPLCNVAYNDNADGKFPGLSKDVVLLNTDEVDYEFNRENPSPSDSVFTAYRTDIGSLIYQDVLKGRIRPIDIETNKPMPVNKFLTWKMPADTMAVYDVNDPSKIAEYRVVQQERSSSEFSRLRIKQDLYFDFKNEILYSVIRSVVIVLAVKSYDGSIRGYALFCRLE
jgi:hypothetical protein